jgi:hypothetical protein
MPWAVESGLCSLSPSLSFKNENLRAMERVRSENEFLRDELPLGDRDAKLLDFNAGAASGASRDALDFGVVSGISTGAVCVISCALLAAISCSKYGEGDVLFLECRYFESLKDASPYEVEIV